MFYYLVLFPNATDGFVYSSNQKIQLGMRVLVDFRGTMRIGFLYSEEDEPEYKTKPILRVLDKECLLVDDLRKTLEFVSFYYVSERGIVLRSMFPRRVFEREECIDLMPVRNRIYRAVEPFNLTESQESVYERISQTKGFGVHLLFGVTGSGKTEVYLRLVDDVLKRGGKAVILVPEIVLTPQYLEILTSRFGRDVINVFHSRLTPKQRFEEYFRFKCSSPAVMVGTRSSVFVDFREVGVVVVDEENDESYKQESSPRYNARDIAIYRARMNDIPVILCSATPSAEDYYKAKVGRYALHELSERIGGVGMPEVRFVQVRGGILAEETRDRIVKTKESRKTTAILINRRGFANYVVCRECGYVLTCPNCSVSLTYHKSSDSLKCHWCDTSFPVTGKCPKCGSVELEPVGFGTQRVEEELRREFPGFIVERLDRDSVSTKGEFERIIGDLREGRIDILVGTQILSKGHDISHIGLVVILNVDGMMGIPDFRARERLVSLIIQTAGRSGRQGPGEVIIQGASRENEILKYVLKHDFKGFIENELKSRDLFGYPPFSHLIRVVVEHRKEKEAYELAKRVERVFRQRGLEVIGASRCPLYRMRNYFRFHVLIKSRRIMSDLKVVHSLRDDALHFDVDPINFF